MTTDGDTLFTRQKLMGDLFDVLHGTPMYADEAGKRGGSLLFAYLHSRSLEELHAMWDRIFSME